MMNIVIGFFESYLLGSPPSKMPPCGVALTLAEAEAEAEAVLVTNCVTVAVAMVVGWFFDVLVQEAETLPQQ